MIHGQQDIIKNKQFSDLIIAARDKEIGGKDEKIKALEDEIIELNRRIAELEKEIIDMRPDTGVVKKKKEKILEDFEDLMYDTPFQHLSSHYTLSSDPFNKPYEQLRNLMICYLMIHYLITHLLMIYPHDKPYHDIPSHDVPSHDTPYQYTFSTLQVWLTLVWGFMIPARN